MEDYEIIQANPILTGEEERELALAIAEGDVEARERLIVCNLRLVISIAKKFRWSGMHPDDVVGNGMLGLIRATESFSSEYRTKFSTYASYWIVQSIRRGISNQRDDIRIPIHVVEKLREWEKMKGESLRNSEAPTDAEIMRACGFTARERELMKAAERARTTASGRYTPWEGDSDEGNLGSVERVVANHTEPDFHSDEFEKLTRLVGALLPREREVIEMRFGIGCESRTLSEIGEKLNLTRERIRQIEGKVLLKLKEQFRV